MTMNYSAEQVYADKHLFVLEQIDHIRNYVEDMPAPGTVKIDWGHVGDIGCIEELLATVVETVQGWQDDEAEGTRC